MQGWRDACVFLRNPRLQLSQNLSQFGALAGWAYDLPLQAHGPMEEPVVMAPTPGHRYSMARLEKSGALVYSPAEVRVLALLQPLFL